MSIKTKDQLQVENQASFPDNTTGLITPAVLRNFNTDIIDTLVDSNATSSFATTDSNTFTGAQTITGSNGQVFLTGTSATTPDNSLQSIHTNDDGPWIARFYNDTFSTSSSVMSYWGYNNGDFVLHNDTTQSMTFGINGYNQNNLVLNDTSITANRELIVSGAIKTNNNITWSGNSFNSSLTGSLYFSALNGGTLLLNTDGGEGDVQVGYNGWNGKLKVIGNSEFTGSQTILSGSIAISNNGNVSSFSDTELNIETTNAPAAEFIVSFNQTASAAVISYDGATYDNELWTIADSAGLRMTDWDGGTGNLSAIPFMSVVANDGSQPAPLFNRGLSVSGSITINSASFSGSAISNITPDSSSLQPTTNIVTLTAGEYAGITPVATTLYIVI